MEVTIAIMAAEVLRLRRLIRDYSAIGLTVAESPDVADGTVRIIGSNGKHASVRWDRDRGLALHCPEGTLWLSEI